MDNQNIAKDIKFEKNTMFGVKREEVDAYVEKVTGIINNLSKENEELIQKMGVLAQRISEYQQEEESIGEVIVKAQKLSKSIVSDARIKADKIEKEAVTAANDITTKAKEKAQEIVNQIKGKAMAELDTLKSKIAHEKRVLELSQSHTTEFKNELFRMYTDQIALINEIYGEGSNATPDYDVSNSTIKTTPIEKKDTNVKNNEQKNRTVMLNEELEKISMLENTADIEAFAQDINGIEMPLSLDDEEKTREFKKVDANSEIGSSSVNADDLMFGKNKN